MKNLILLLLISIFISLSVSAQQNAPDLILYNGKIFTSDAEKPSAEAIAIRGERISAVGSNAEIKKLAGAKTRLIDLQMRVVTPGFNDAHYHVIPDPNGFDLQFSTLEPTWEEAKTAIEAAVKKVPAGTWIYAYVGSTIILNEQVTRHALDKIAPNHPVLLRAYYGHGHILNSKAMPLLQIADEEPDPLGGRFERVGSTKKINGRFWEYAEWKPNRILAREMPDAKVIEELKKTAAEAAGFGITSMQIMSFMPVDRFARLLVKADLPIRVRAIPFATTFQKSRDLSEFEMLSKLKFPNSKVTASGIKWVLDGTPIERGAAFRQPYDSSSDWRGRLNFPESEIIKMVRESLSFKQQILFHCAGDRTAEAVFDALDEVGGGKIDWKSKRVRVEHGDGVIEDLIPRAVKLGVIIVQNPTHFAQIEGVDNRPESLKKLTPLRSLIEAGIPVAIGSDGPMNPFLNIMLASIHPARPSEAITREQAVKAYTFYSAYAEFAEQEKGTLTIGKLADLTVLSQDIFTAPVPELPKTHSILTILGGKIVHDAKVLK